MRNRFDHAAKQIGLNALAPSGTIVINDEISPETQYADLRHEPDPARQAERDRLGLLGRIAAFACLIEVYSQAPSAEEFRACLAKHLAAWQQRARKTRSDSKKRGAQDPPPDAGVDPFLWIIAAGAPTTLLTRLKLDPAGGWPAGVYLFGDDVLRVGIIVASELPRDRTTLLVRIMAAGPLLPQAVKEVAALAPDAYERAVAEPVLLNLQHALAQAPSRTPDEQEFIMAMYKTWEEGRIRGANRGPRRRPRRGAHRDAGECGAHGAARSWHRRAGRRANAHPGPEGSTAAGALARKGHRRHIDRRGHRRPELRPRRIAQGGRDQLQAPPSKSASSDSGSGSRKFLGI